MSSLFKSRRSPEPSAGAAGSGGKILRGRRPPPPSSPYRRPPPAAAAETPSPSWISGIFSIPGRIISSVFGDDGESESEDESFSGDSQDEDTDAEVLPAINQRGNQTLVIRDHAEPSRAIVPKSESKLAIEHLLKQETFSRDECKKLVEILQTRVVDSPSTEASDDYRSLNQHNEFQDASLCSPNVLDSFSPGLSGLQSCTPELRAKAVMEAKKWLEEKKLSSSKVNTDCGPCTLNTEPFRYDVEDAQGSPADMAKSYMHSLPPWQSPSFGSNGFKTPSPSGPPLYWDHTPMAISHSLPPSKALKRSHLAIEPWNAPDESRRVRMKSKNSLLESNNGESITNTSLLDHNASIISSATGTRAAKTHCTDGAISLLDENVNEVNHRELDSITSVELEYVSNLPEAELGSETKLSVPDTPIPHEIPDAEEPLKNKENMPSDIIGLPSTPRDHDDSSPPEKKCQLQEETEEFSHEIAAGSAPTKNGDPPCSWIRDLNLTPTSSNIKPLAHIYEESSELSNEAGVDAAVNAANSLEPRLTGSPTSRRGKRGRARKGRGKLK